MTDHPFGDEPEAELDDGCWCHYGHGPGVKCSFMQAVEGSIPADVLAWPTAPSPREEWPPNFREDPECPGLGTWICDRCMNEAAP